jgi:hypothetical protein
MYGIGDMHVAAVVIRGVDIEYGEPPILEARFSRIGMAVSLPQAPYQT